MGVAGKRCGSCGSVVPDREVGEDEVCQCGSRICLLQSAQVCITTNRARASTFLRSDYEAKSLDAPPKDRMVHAAAVTRK